MPLPARPSRRASLPSCVFVDRALITIKAGDGGSGHVSFRREKFSPKGGPTGGNGGRGGSVIIVAEEGMSTLYDYRFQLRYEAQNGDPGGAKQCSGGDGKDLVLKLPAGTLIFNNATGELIHDLRNKETITIAAGGKGGYGNEHFKSSTYQTPRESTPGEKGPELNLRLELKLIADVGFLGKPNAGKSTLLAALTRANPKIADYPFTTLSPQLGIAEVDAHRRIVLADIPGLIEGAAKGAGLGLEFLRHVERTRVLVHLVDIQPGDGSDPAENYRVIREELRQHSQALYDKRELVVLNKIDLVPDKKEREKLIKKLCRDLELRLDRDVIAISGATRENVTALLTRLWRELNPTDDVEGWKSEPLPA